LFVKRLLLRFNLFRLSFFNLQRLNLFKFRNDLSCNHFLLSTNYLRMSDLSSPAKKSTISAPRYEILTADIKAQWSVNQPQPDELVKKVNAALQAGAKLAGGMSAIVINNPGSGGEAYEIRYSQAVLYETN